MKMDSTYIQNTGNQIYRKNGIKIKLKQNSKCKPHIAIGTRCENVLGARMLYCKNPETPTLRGKSMDLGSVLTSWPCVIYVLSQLSMKSLQRLYSAERQVNKGLSGLTFQRHMYIILGYAINTGEVYLS